MFEDRTGVRYPDFYKDNIVLDAKYKRYADMKLQNIDGDDLHQVITYMYILGARYGGLIVPRQHKQKDIVQTSKLLNGYGGRMNIYSIIVDSPAQNYNDYCIQMNQHENEFISLLEKSTGE